MSFVDECNTTDDSVVNPPENAEIDETVIVVFEDRIMRIFERLYDLKHIATIKECAPAKVYSLDADGKKISLYQSPIGAPATAIFMERAIAFGGRKFLFFGSCGGICEGITSGELIVPTEAYRGEGTSCYYVPYEEYITMEGSDEIAALMQEFGLGFKKGRVWTTDAMFRETPDLVDKRVSEGCIGVEMECSLIAAISRTRDVFATSILFTDDVLADDEWHQYEKSKVLNDTVISKIVKIAANL